MNFNEFNFASPLAKAVAQCGYTLPTQIQQQAMPHLLKGEDLLGLAQTGTGKTAAFLLPTLQKLIAKKETALRALVLVPTRELAEQVYENTRQLTRGTKLRSCTVYGGVSKFNQIKNLQRGVDIVIACPGRLLDHIHSKTIDLSNLEVMILDEADQMCDKGFLPDIRRILKYVPKERQSMVFSATMPDEVRGFVENMLHNPVTVQVDHDKPTATISHSVYQIAQNKKTSLLKALLHSEEISTALVFTRTKYKAKNLARILAKDGLPVTSLQGNLSQNQRKVAMDGFRSGRFKILVATDIAARGIDVFGISHVINYDVPDTVEAYTHRVGRTGRAQESGQALTFATLGDKRILHLVERQMGNIFTRKSTKGFVLDAEPKGPARFEENSESVGNEKKTGRMKPARKAKPGNGSKPRTGSKPRNSVNSGNAASKEAGAAQPEGRKKINRPKKKNTQNYKPGKAKRSKRRSASFDFGLTTR